MSGYPEVNDTVGIYSDWAGPNGVIRDNTITRHTVGLELVGGSERAVSNSIGANDTGVQLDASPSQLLANSIVGNTVGAAGVGTGGPNWWGCNTGPNTVGCDSSTGTYNEPDWLVLSLTLTTCTVTIGNSITAALSLATTRSGVVTNDAYVPPTLITPISGTKVSPTPVSGMTSNGTLLVSLKGMTEGNGAVEAQAVNATVSAPSPDSGCPDSLYVLPTLAFLAPTGFDPLSPLALGLLLILGGAALTTRERHRHVA